MFDCIIDGGKIRVRVYGEWFGGGGASKVRSDDKYLDGKRKSVTWTQ